VISELKPDGNSIHHVSQQSQRGGGVAIVFNSDLKIEQISNEIQFTHFEKLECMVSSENKKIRLCVIYRPSPSRTNNFRNSVFFDEWSDFLDQVAVTPDELIITGDLIFLFRRHKRR
jgi:exonuclease III